MNKTKIMIDPRTNTEMILFQTDEGNISVPVTFASDTLWLSLNQISELFERDKSVISRHLSKIFREEELDKLSTVAFFATVQNEGGHSVERSIEYFNLDAIISVGYRVNSKRGTGFRKWSNKILKDYIGTGYSINHTSLSPQMISNMRGAIEILSNTLKNQNFITEAGEQILQIIINYSKTWDLLLKYDENNLPKTGKESASMALTYYEASNAISSFKLELSLKDQATSLFGLERDRSLEAILQNIEQTFDEEPLYRSLFSKAAHLLYFIIKDHPFTDGNKRIASFLFILYLHKNYYDITHIPNNSLVALALLIAESDPNSKETIIDLTINLLKN